MSFACQILQISVGMINEPIGNESKIAINQVNDFFGMKSEKRQKNFLIFRWWKLFFDQKFPGNFGDLRIPLQALLPLD